MRKNLILLFCGMLVTTGLLAQTSKHYQLKDDQRTKEVYFQLKTTSGDYHIKPTFNTNLLNIYGRLVDDALEPELEDENLDGQRQISLNLHQPKLNAFSHSISRNIFSSNADQGNLWTIFLSRSKPYHLQFSYGLGNALVDLSGLSVQNLKINTGSADVAVNYEKGERNLIPMDTFYVKVDMGNLNVGRCNLARAKQMIAHVGFGKLSLDFTEEALERSNVHASVGAGSLSVALPSIEIPVMIRINRSPLCNVKLNNNFTELENNVFVNKAYAQDAENLLTFDVDVSLGNITFHQKD